ncbi:MAG: hypothetical protein CMN05_15670 [Roseibacillus sp.]|jgi:hypothetical protein|nr:hypothetical protein [Roseibacillus sp.]MBP35495.1 hypothetical protein [Roseibacillus sp.]|tara:strand:- start:14116 stop:14688 length:573 start_codon:yes stop_codon:yes gene_type:complete
MPLADSWHIKSRAHHCSVTEKPFTEGETFFTALLPDPESDGYLRLDFSQEAWDARGEQSEQPFSFWRTVYRPPEVEAKVEIIDRDDPEALLTSLIEQDEAHTENTRYILAVMLERKKILIETDSQKTRSGLLRIYQHRYSGEIFIVKDPQIPLSQVTPLQEEVQKLLSPDEEAPAEGESGEPPAVNADGE